MGKYKIKVGIIGGSGLEDIANRILESATEIKPEELKNDFGEPSGAIYSGILHGVEVALLSRHGSGHRLSPSQVNYRANIEALKMLGCTHILASNACGSLVEDIGRGKLVVLTSFIDRTNGRKGTMFDGSSSKYPGVCHVPMEPAFHPEVRNVLLKAGETLGLNMAPAYKGTIISVEGPRFSSRAESKAFRMWGAELIGMTTCPEVCLAKEAGLLYASIAMVTDNDCWDDKCDNDGVCVPDVMAVFKQNVSKVTQLIIKAVELIGKRDWDQEIDDLKDLIKSSNMTK
ncbi:S-methyl-5'-thioadenosine phosphorylase-like [Chelonus insularis]|uniref:S-methyl-5'-thioadenosine phosphorylase-like n=1 Tax=Chelonus insularis TaxID=460826 RepID=UPI00158D278D|nr:S-methyl-5'-thioadenosine phosphorylase-like [Chelonus insularis]